MKPPVKPQIPSDDKTEFENFVELTKQILTVSKDEFNAKRLSDKQHKQNKKLQSKTLKQKMK